MIHLAELNENNICIGVKTVKHMINDGRHVEIAEPDFDYYIWRKYEGSEWSKVKFEPESAAPLTEFETLKQKNQELELALLEMTTVSAMQEQKIQENEQAILELSMLLAGGIE